MKFFSIWAFLFSFMTFYVVEEGSGGGGDNAGGAGEGDGDNSGGGDNAGGAGEGGDNSGGGDNAGGAGEGGDNSGGSEGGDNAGGAGEGEGVDKAEIARLAKIVDGYEEDKAIDTIVSDIQSRHEDFDPIQIKAHLKKIKETDPDEAARLNNPNGWELLHLREFAKKEVTNEYVGHGREGEGVDRSAEILEKVQNGGINIADEAVVLSKLM